MSRWKREGAWAPPCRSERGQGVCCWWRARENGSSWPWRFPEHGLRARSRSAPAREFVPNSRRAACTRGPTTDRHQKLAVTQAPALVSLSLGLLRKWGSEAGGCWGWRLKHHGQERTLLGTRHDDEENQRRHTDGGHRRLCRC